MFPCAAALAKAAPALPWPGSTEVSVEQLFLIHLMNCCTQQNRKGLWLWLCYKARHLPLVSRQSCFSLGVHRKSAPHWPPPLGILHSARLLSLIAGCRSNPR